MFSHGVTVVLDNIASVDYFYNNSCNWETNIDRPGKAKSVWSLSSSQKASIAELKVRLEEERDLRREEREKGAADLKEAVQRAHLEAQAELKRWSDAALRREKEQQEVLDKLQVWKCWNMESQFVKLIQMNN